MAQDSFLTRFKAMSRPQCIRAMKWLDDQGHMEAYRHMDLETDIGAREVVIQMVVNAHKILTLQDRPTIADSIAAIYDAIPNRPTDDELIDAGVNPDAKVEPDKPKAKMWRNRGTDCLGNGPAVYEGSTRARHIIDQAPVEDLGVYKTVAIDIVSSALSRTRANVGASTGYMMKDRKRLAMIKKVCHAA